MIRGNKIYAGSNWDSGTHLNFYAGVDGDDKYSLDTLDKVLTKEQIKTVETVIYATIVAMLSEASQSNNTKGEGDESSGLRR